MHIRQDYSLYTEADHKVWSLLFHNQTVSITDKALPAFLKGIAEIELSANKIPDFEKVNRKLLPITGWQITAVEGIVPYQEFFELLSSKRFPCTTWIRKESELGYIEEPDIFHDLFGHVPLLAHSLFSDFVCSIAHIALENLGNTYVIDLISRLYWFTVEFGLVREPNTLKAYGAGILSSISETKFSLESQESVQHPFCIDKILQANYSIDTIQKEYYIVKGLEELHSIIILLKDKLRK
jgi:phenylalanine-4-hydroxylase